MPDQKTYTADDFKRAVYAHRGDGMRATKRGPNWWVTANNLHQNDQEMAGNGWVPTADLDDAPTTDEGPIDYKVLFGREEARAEKAAQERDAAQKALDEHSCGDQAERAYRRAIAAEQKRDEAESECGGWRVRAEAAESQRNKWREIAKRWEVEGDEARTLAASRLGKRENTMTARELLDAAWEAAHVPEDGIIPEGCMFLDRGTAGVVVVGAAGNDLASRGSSWERRLVDPPTPKRPEGAEEWEDWLIDNLDHEALSDQQIEDLANRIAQRALAEVGLTENTEKEKDR